MANRNDDIVKRLRDHCYECQEEAANEIERLRKENEDMRAIVSLQGEVVKLAQRRHEERDEARREVCQIMHYTGYLCGDYANHRKWDCYKDDRHHPFSEEIKQNFKAWMDGQYELHAKEIKRLKDERDEARRAVCCGSLPSDYKTWKPADVDAALKLVAAQQGWDCFKEENGNGR